MEPHNLTRAPDRLPEVYSSRSYYISVAAIAASLFFGAVGGFFIGQRQALQALSEYRRELARAKASAKQETERAELEAEQRTQLEAELRAAGAAYAQKQKELEAEHALREQEPVDAGQAEAEFARLKDELDVAKANLVRAHDQMASIATLPARNDDQGLTVPTVEHVTRQEREKADATGKEREKASEAAQVRLTEHALTARSQLITVAAVQALKQISALHNDDKAIDLGRMQLNQATFREMAEIVRIAGDFIPKGSKYTFSESWTYALGGKNTAPQAKTRAPVTTRPMPSIPKKEPQARDSAPRPSLHTTSPRELLGAHLHSIIIAEAIPSTETIGKHDASQPLPGFPPGVEEVHVHSPVLSTREKPRAGLDSIEIDDSRHHELFLRIRLSGSKQAFPALAIKYADLLAIQHLEFGDTSSEKMRASALIATCVLELRYPDHARYLTLAAPPQEVVVTRQQQAPIDLPDLWRWVDSKSQAALALTDFESPSVRGASWFRPRRVGKNDIRVPFQLRVDEPGAESARIWDVALSSRQEAGAPFVCHLAFILGGNSDADGRFRSGIVVRVRDLLVDK